MQDSTDWNNEAPEDKGSGGTAIAISLVVIALIGILSGVVLAVTGSDDDVPPVIALPGGPSTEIGAGNGATTPVGSDSPLVGLTEIQVRERYPIVRIVEVDGTPRPATMDLQHGRVNLTIVNGEVAGAFVEGCEDKATVAPELAWAMTACEPSDADEADASGTVAASADGDAARLVFRSADSALDGLVLRPLSDQPAVSDIKGNHMDLSELQVGDEINLWTVGQCGASEPPRCTIGAIVVTKGP